MPSQSQNLPDQLQQKTLKMTDLQIIVKEWLQYRRLAKKESTYCFKFSLQNILPLPQNLLQNVVLYICYVKFPYVFEDLSVQQKMKKNLFLKSIYQQQFYHGKWKKQFFFEFTMVFVTKTVSKFISQYFPSLDINENLQSQIFIILHSVLIGNEIGTKIYHIISKKYVKQIIRKSTKNQIKASISVGKKDSFATAYKPSTKYISEVMNSESHGGTKNRIFYGNNPNNIYPQNVNMRRNNCRNKISFVRADSWQRSNLDIFSEQLKKNLYVEPLPVLKPKKMDISEYEMVKYGSVQTLQKRKIGQAFIKPVNLRTTKISSSLDTLIALNHPNFSTHEQNRPGKILLSRQLNSKHYCLTSCSNHHESNQKPLAQILDKDLKFKNNPTKSTGKFTYEEWNQLLKKIRFNSKNSTMFEKENINLGKSFESSGQSHTMNEISYEKYGQKDDLRQFEPRNNRSGNELLPIKLLSQHHEVHHFASNPNRKSQNLENTKDIEEQNFGKLGMYTKSIDPGNLAGVIQSPSSEPHTFFKKQSLKSHKKLAKTSKLKLEKLTFLSECKKRENKLNEGRGRTDIKIVIY